MATLGDPARLLSAWEAAAAVPDVARGAVLIHHAGLVGHLDDAVDLPIGRSAAIAARLYIDAFGDVIDGVLRCPGCGQTLDVALPLHAVDSVGPRDVTTVTAVPGRKLEVRAPTTRDLLAVRQTDDPASALMGRCIRDEAGEPVSPADLAEDVRRRVDAAAEELAGAAGIVIRTTCPDCGTDVAAPLDVPGLLWERVAAAAPTVLAEIAELAAAFGWSEADVLGLTPTRRRMYLGLSRGGLS